MISLCKFLSFVLCFSCVLYFRFKVRDIDVCVIKSIDVYWWLVMCVDGIE